QLEDEHRPGRGGQLFRPHPAGREREQRQIPGDPHPHGRKHTARPRYPPAVHAEVDAEEIRRCLSRAVARLCPRVLGHERDDLVQASLVRVLERLRDGGVDDLNATYLWKTAYAVVLDELR